MVSPVALDKSLNLSMVAFENLYDFIILPSLYIGFFFLMVIKFRAEEPSVVDL